MASPQTHNFALAGVWFLVFLLVPKYLSRISHESPRPDDPKSVQIRSSVAPSEDASVQIRSIVTPSEDASPVWWNDINYELRSCGKTKCHFPRVSDPAKEYLVRHCRHSARLKKAVRAYNYAAFLESKYNIRQLYSSPPYKSGTPESFAERLTAREAKKYRGAGFLVVQESFKVPEGSRMFKCKQRDASMKYMIANGNKGYEYVLLRELSNTSRLLESEPRLAFNFQFMMDLDGRIYHIDLDRALVPRWGHRATSRGRAVSNARFCLEDAANYIRSAMAVS